MLEDIVVGRMLFDGPEAIELARTGGEQLVVWRGRCDRLGAIRRGSSPTTIVAGLAHAPNLLEEAELRFEIGQPLSGGPREALSNQAAIDALLVVGCV